MEDEPYECSECGEWTEHGIFSELDDSFVCDCCTVDAASGMEMDCD